MQYGTTNLQEIEKIDSLLSSERSRVESDIKELRRIYGENPYMWPQSGKVEFVKEDFDGTNEKQWVRVWNACLDSVLEILRK